MVQRPNFINKIRALGFSYKRRCGRADIYRKRGTTDIISVPHAKLLDEGYIAATLRQNGVREDEIESFFMSIELQ